MSDGSDEARRLEKRAERLGLPTDPEAYRDGGLAVAATAYRPQDAEVLAGILRGAGVPAWVRSPFSAITLWHIQPGARPGGVAVLVPLGRLKDAQAILAEHKDAAKAADQAEARSTEDAGDAIPTKARRIATLLLAGTAVAPYVLVHSVWWLTRVRPRLKRKVAPYELRRATGWMAATAVLAVPISALVAYIILQLAAALWE